MLTQHRLGFLMALLTLLLVACGPEQTPEAQVRSVIAAGEVAAEARDLSALMELVAADFRDEQVGGRAELQQYLRGYLVTHQSIHLLTRVDSVELPYRDMAKVSLTIGTLGRDSAAASALELAADVYDVQLELRFDGDDWRVTRASWRPAAR
jgi:hypothetical protein